MMASTWMWLAWAGMAGGVAAFGWAWAKAGGKGRGWLEWGLAAVVAGVSAVSVLTHEPWADELHAWVQARDMTAWQLWTEMRYEGHFVPWDWILHPFARWGAPVAAMGWVSWAINAGTVAWFARKAPLGGTAKAAVALSCVFAYVNPVVSRPYVLVPPVLFGMAALWGKRDERPVAFGVLTGLLANTHIYMEGVVTTVFLVFAWENVLHRADGKGWRACGRQWAGLAAMAAGGMAALAQILPSLWSSSLVGACEPGWRNARNFLDACNSPWGAAAALVGFAWLCATAWRRDRGLFWTLAGGVAYMVGFAVFLYSAAIINRSSLWWPLAVGAAWVLGAKENGRGQRSGFGVEAAVVAMGLGLMGPGVTWHDWRHDFEPVTGACRFIAQRYGKDAEVWINGQNFMADAAAAYLDNLWDWQTGKEAERLHFKAGWEYAVEPFGASRARMFRMHPGREQFLVLAVLEDGSGLMPETATAAGMEVEYLSGVSMLGKQAMVVKMPGNAGGRTMMGDSWMMAGMKYLEKGDRTGAKEAWTRAVEATPGQWEAMNNLAWLLLEEGRVEDARAWMDRAMANEAARASAGAWDTEAAVRRAEGNEEGAREAEGMREELKNAQCTMQNAQ